MASPDAESDRVAITESILNSIGDGVVFVDGRGNRVVNAEGRRILGSTADAPPNEWPARLAVFQVDQRTPVSPEDFPLTKALRGETTEEAEYFVRHAQAPDGIFVRLSARPFRNHDGEVAGAVSIFHDITAKRRDEARNRRLGAIVDSVDDAIISTVQLGKIAGWNPGAERLFGYRREEAIGQSIRMIYAAEPPAELRERIRRGERIPPFESDVLVKGGGVVRVLVSVSPLTGADGSVTGSALIIRDLTEVKRVEASRLHLATIVESVDDAIISTDQEGKVSGWNPGAERLLGFTRDEAIGQSGVIVYGRTPPPGIQERLLRGERIPPFEAELVRKNGQPVRVLSSVSPLKDEQGRVIGAGVILRDLTMIKRAEEARLRLAAIVESSADAILAKDLEGRIVSWNGGAERLYGYQSDEILGRPVSLLVPPELRDEFDEIMKRVIGGNRIEQYDTRRLRKDGSVVDVSITVSPLWDSRGVIVGASAIGRDITERRRADEEIKRLNAEHAEFAQRLRNVFDSALDAVVTMNADGRISDWNRTAERIFGWRASQVVGRLLSDKIMPARHRDAHRLGLEHYLETGEGRILGRRMEIEALHRDGHEFPIELSIAVTQSDGHPVFSGFIRDITETRQREHALRVSEERYRQIVETAFEGIWHINAQEKTTFVNRRMADMLGYAVEEIMGRPVTDFMDAEAQALFAANLAGRRAGLVPHETRFLRKDGSVLITSLEASPSYDEAGKYTGSLAMLSDVTARKHAELALQAQTSLYEALVKAQSDLGELIVLTDGDRPIYINDAFSRLSGYTTDELMTMDNLFALAAPDALDPAALRRPTPGGEIRTLESVLVTKQGKRIDMEVTYMRFESGGRPLIFTLARDISARKESQQAVEHQATHDALTGLPNRTQLAHRLKAALEASRSDGRPLALLMLNLDHFKDVNETFGHEAGDRFLEQVGARLQGELRGEDVVARLGGDEFAMLSFGIDETAVDSLAARLLEALDRPIEVDGQLLDLAASIGIVTSPKDGDTADVLLRRAQIALSVAKRDRGSFARFAPEQEKHGASQLALMAELRRAIVADQLRLEYQPLVSFRDGMLRGVEALVRWEHPERGTVPPADFIPFAEKTRLIQPLTRWVMTNALRQSKQWRAAGQAIPVAINISMRDLLDAEFPEAVAAALREAGAQPDWLRLEITEGVIMAEPQRAMETMGRLRALGVRIAVDDFGTGYSSLAYLHRLPLDELKIDRSFINEMFEGSSGANIVRASVELGHSLRLETVAEGVADERTWELLAALGCDTAQGYFISRPLRPEDLLRWYRRWEAGPWGPRESKHRPIAA